MRPSLPQSAVGGFTDIVRHLIDFRPAFRNKLAMLADAKMQMSIRWILMRLRDEVAKHKNTIRYWSRPPRGECEGSFLDKVISEAAYKAGMRNAIRFQGQYYDEETGLHFNRNRYYDPHSGRFISKDPISLEGGINLHLYAPNTTDWTDPLGLAPRRPAHESSIQRKVSCLKSQGFQELHIISDKNSQTKSHPLIGLAGFDLQSQANKIYLPNDGSLHPERSIHNSATRTL